MILGFAPNSGRFEYSPEQHGDLDERLAHLRDALGAIYRGQWDEAEGALASGGNDPSGDAGILNLLGIISQGRGEWKKARRFFGRAMAADRNFAPAEQNVRRIYELRTFGRTDLPVAYIDGAMREAMESRFAVRSMRE